MITRSCFARVSHVPRRALTVNQRSWRLYSSAAAKPNSAGALPLEGYRVLDMTRVLAGVSLFFFFIVSLLAEELACILLRNS